MTNIHKAFRQTFRAQCESRFCHMAPPPDKIDALAGSAEELPEVLEQIERQRPYWDQVKNYLNAAVLRNGSPELKKIWLDPLLQKWIIAQVIRDPDDGTLIWMNDTAQAHAITFDERFKDSEDQIRQIKLQATVEIGNMVNAYNTALEIIKRAKEKNPALSTATYERTLGAGAVTVTPENVIAIIEKFSDEDVIKSRQHTLVDIAREVINGSSVPDIEAAMIAVLERDKENLAKISTNDVMYIAPGAAVTTQKHFLDLKSVLDDATGKYRNLEERVTAVLEVIEKAGKVAFDPDDLKDLEAALAEAKEQSAIVDKDKDMHIEKVFEKQSDYLRRLGGDDLRGYIRDSFRNDKGLSLDHLYLKLEVLLARKLTAVEKTDIEKAAGLEAPAAAGGVPPGIAARMDTARIDDLADKYGLTPVEKTAVVNAAPQLLYTLLTEGQGAVFETLRLAAGGDLATVKVALDAKNLSQSNLIYLLRSVWKTDDLERYMRENLDLQNSAGVSLVKLQLRARLPADVADNLIKSQTEVEIAGKKIDIRFSVGNLVKVSQIGRLGLPEGDIDPTVVIAVKVAIDSLPILPAEQITAKGIVDDYHAAAAGTPKRAEAKKLFDFLESKTSDRALLIRVEEAFGPAVKKIDEKAAIDLVDLFSEPDGAQLFIDRENFIETLTFLKLQEKGGAETEAQKAREARIEAQKIWDNLLTIGAISHKGDDLFDVNRDKCVAALQKVTLGNLAVSHHQKMRLGGVDEATWAQSMQMYIHEIKEVGKVAGTSWWEYIKNLKDNVWHEDDPALLEIIERREGLDLYAKAIQKTLNASDKTGARMESAIEQLQKLKEARETLSKPLKPTAKVIDHIQQAEYLVKANARVIGILRSESSWDNLPESIRQVSLWLAMNKGTKKNPDAGIDAALKFIRAFHSAERAHTDYANAQSAYINSPTKDNYKAYLAELEAYQFVANLDVTIYNTYRTAIKDLDSAIASGDAAAIDAAVKVYEPAHVAYVNALNAYEAGKAGSIDPGALARETFLRNWFAHPSNKKDVPSILRFIRKIETLEELEGKDNLAFMWHRHHLAVKPLAIISMAEARIHPKAAGATFPETNLTLGTYSVDRWLIEGHRQFANDPLELIVNGEFNPEGKKALIEAYVQQKDVTYEYDNPKTGKKEDRVMTAAEAFTIVSEIKRRIQYQSEQHQPSEKLLGKEYGNFFENPLDRGVRATVEALQDMWAGDWVDKAKVIVAFAAAIYLIRHIWKKGGEEGGGIFKMLKWGLIGLPLLMVANTAYKTRTGRDLLGEKLLYMPRDVREGALESWRRRGHKYDSERYKYLNHNSGIAAMGELMDKQDPVSAKDLLTWRKRVKENGYHEFKHGAPANLNIGRIRSQLGAQSSEDEAYKVAFLTFEALCVDVAALHGRSSGDVRNRAEWGADYIERNYVLMQAYKDDDPAMVARMRGRPINMLDVILSEAQVPSLKNDILKDQTFLERLAELTGFGVEKVQSLLSRGYAVVDIMRMRAIEAAPGVIEGTKKFALDTKEKVHNWLKTTLPKTSETFVDNFWASILGIGRVGAGLVETAGHGVEFVTVGAVEITASGLAEVKDFRDKLHTWKLLSLARKFDEWILAAFGYDFLKELNVEEAKRQWNTEFVAFARYIDGGEYPIRDEKPQLADGRTNAIVRRLRTDRTDKMVFLGSDDNPLGFENTKDAMGNDVLGAKALLEENLKKLAYTLYVDKTFNPNPDVPPASRASVDGNWNALTPAQRRYTLEILQANMFRNIGSDPDIKGNVTKFNADVNSLRRARDLAKSSVDTARQAQDTAEKQIEKFKDEFHLAWEADEATLTAKKTSVDGVELPAAQAEEGDAAANLARVQADYTAANWAAKIALSIQLNIAKDRDEKAKKEVRRLEDLQRALPVYIVLSRHFARPPAAKPNNAQVNAIPVAADRDELLVNHPAEFAAAKALFDNFTSANFALANAIVSVGTAEDAYKIADNALSAKLVSGIAAVEIKASEIFAGIDPKIFRTAAGDRKEDILDKAFVENPALLMIIPLEWLVGDTLEEIRMQLKTWKQRRLENDQTYLRVKERGRPEDADALAAYEGYLSQVAVNEIFIRGMAQSYGPNEKLSPIHISIEEADTIDQHLIVRERLVSFAKYLEDHEKVHPDFRP